MKTLRVCVSLLTLMVLMISFDLISFPESRRNADRSRAKRVQGVRGFQQRVGGRREITVHSGTPALQTTRFDTDLIPAPPGASLPVHEYVARSGSLFSSIPEAFIPNPGWYNKSLLYVLRCSANTAGFTVDGAFINASAGNRGVTLHRVHQGARPVRPVTSDPVDQHLSFMVGDLGDWRRKEKPCSALTYERPWPFIDVRYSAHAEGLEYAVTVNPGGMLSDFKVAYKGAESVSVDEAGSLRIATELGTLTETPPKAYQLIDGQKVDIPCRFEKYPDSSVGFACADFSRDVPLVIDPVLNFGTFLGGTLNVLPGGGRIANDRIADMDIDAFGNVYVCGSTECDDFPTTPGAYDRTWNGDSTDSNVFFVSKLSSDGHALLWSTFFAQGTWDHERISGISVGEDGSVAIAGMTAWAAHPVTTGAVQTLKRSLRDGFVCRFTPDGSDLMWSTFLGGEYDDWVRDVDMDADGCVYVTGYTASATFPTTPNAYRTTLTRFGYLDAFVSKISADGASLIWSTYVGSESNDEGRRIHVDSVGNVFIVGHSDSTQFPTTVGAYSRSAYGTFVVKLNPQGTDLVWSTRFYRDAFVNDMSVDPWGCVVITGQAVADDFPTTIGAYDRTPRDEDMRLKTFVTKFSAEGSALRWSTFLGTATLTALALDRYSNVYVTGYTESQGFPVTSDALVPTARWVVQGFVSKLSYDGSTLLYSSYIGGAFGNWPTAVAVPPSHDRQVIVAGSTYSYDGQNDFMTTRNAYDPSPNVSVDAFVMKLTFGPTSLWKEISGDPAEGWRMVGVIGDPQNPKSSVTASDLIDNPSESIKTGFLGFTSATGYTASLNLIPGRGYWVKTSLGSLTQDIANIPSGPLGIPLTQGWNLIANPHADEVSWPTGLAGIEGPYAYRDTGSGHASYARVPTLRRFEGAWVKAARPTTVFLSPRRVQD